MINRALSSSENYSIYYICMQFAYIQITDRYKESFMFKYSKDGVSVLTILDTRRAKINGLFPVKVQVVFRRKQKYYSTGKELSKEDWDRLLKAKSQLLMEVRTDIESSFSIIKQQVSELIQKENLVLKY